MIETSILKFHNKYYITSIKKLAFHLPHVRIIGTHNCGKECHEEFKLRSKQHDVLCRSDYEDHIVSIFAHQIKSESCGGNRSVSIEGIELENFSASNQASLSLTYEAVS